MRGIRELKYFYITNTLHAQTLLHCIVININICRANLRQCPTSTTLYSHIPSVVCRVQSIAEEMRSSYFGLASELIGTSTSRYWSTSPFTFEARATRRKLDLSTSSGLMSRSLSFSNRGAANSGGASSRVATCR